MPEGTMERDQIGKIRAAENADGASRRGARALSPRTMFWVGRLAGIATCVVGLGVAGAGACTSSHAPEETGANENEGETNVAQQAVSGEEESPGQATTCKNFVRGQSIVEDTYVHSGAPNNNYGSSST